MAGKKVLIIDDEIDLSLLLKGYFLRKNYEVYISHNFSEGCDALKTVTPDILFIDNNLPDGSGWEAAPRLATEYPNMFICLVSAFHPTVPAMPENDRYTVIEKPISLNDLDKQFESL
jgi:DNA-binding NtrC family response regulator